MSEKVAAVDEHLPMGRLTALGLQHVLVIGAYMMHKLSDPDDTASFFYGDGAGAALLSQPLSASRR